MEDPCVYNLFPSSLTLVIAEQNHMVLTMPARITRFAILETTPGKNSGQPLESLEEYTMSL